MFYAEETFDDIERDELRREVAAQHRGDRLCQHQALHPEQYDEPPEEQHRED